MVLKSVLHKSILLLIAFWLIPVLILWLIYVFVEAIFKKEFKETLISVKQITKTLYEEFINELEAL